MASTAIRWMNLIDVIFTYGTTTIRLNDSMGGSMRTTSQMIGSNSENDDYANHFVQGMKIADEMSMRSYDIASAVRLKAKRGVVGAASMKVPKASQSYGGTVTNNVLINTSTATGAGAMIQDVSITADKDGEAVAEISIIFRSAGGTASGMVVTLV